MGRLISLFIFLFLPMFTWADETDSVGTKDELGIIRRTVRGFDRLNEDYIEPQHFIWTVMLQTTHTYDIYSLSSGAPNRQSLTFAPDKTLRVGPYIGWKWFFAGYTFKLGNINLSEIKQELDFSVYSSQVGVDLFYRRTGSNYHIRNARLTSSMHNSSLEGAPFDGLQAGITGFNVYYIFNHGRFSYPAAFAQSTIQKVSCGSPMAGIGYSHHSLSLDYDRLQRLVDERLGANTVKLDSSMMFSKVDYNDFNLSGGYAYNWVFHKNWVLGACGQIAIAYKKSKGDVPNDKWLGFKFENVHLDMIGRFGLCYNCMRWYAGASVILHSYNYHKSRFSTNNTFGSMNLYIGYNFCLKPSYRERHETHY